MTEKNSTLFKQKGTTLKKFVAMLLALVMVFALCACGSNGDKAAANNNGDYHLVLKLSHVFAPTEQLTIEMQQVAQRIKERTNGAIEIQCYDSSQLAVYKDNIEQVVNGADWIACEDPSYLADYDIDFEALIGPMMYNSIDEYSYVCQSDLVKGMCQKLEDNYGIHVLALDFNVGMRCMQTNKVIKTPADLKGMKIRVPNSSMYINCLTAMGATPTGMPFSETISAVQQGVIDGLEGNMNAYSTNGSAEVCKNMSLTNHLVGTCGAYISSKVWNSIPEEYRTIIQEEFTKGAKELTDFTNASFAETKAKLEKEQGCSFNEVDVDAFRAAVQPEFDRMVKEDGVWYVDPATLQSNEQESTATPTNALATQPVLNTSHPDLLIYYNPEGGTYYHIDPNCESLNPKYRPLSGVIKWSQIEDDPYDKLEQCKRCGAPLREKKDNAN